MLRESSYHLGDVPNASHMGGVWEHQIRSVRNVLSALTRNHRTQLDNESLCTLMCEVAAIVNSRPLSVQNMNDPMLLEPLTTNHLLTMKSKLKLPPPGQFQWSDLCSKDNSTGHSERKKKKRKTEEEVGKQ